MPEWYEPDEDEIDSVPPPTLSDALLDSWLLKHYPGRFLDEISEQMDIFRFLRAMEARGIETIEDMQIGLTEAGDNKPKFTEEQNEQRERQNELFDWLTRDNDA